MTTEEVVRTAIELKCKLLKLNPDRMTLKVVELGTTHVLSTVEVHVDYRDSYQAHDGTVMVALRTTQGLSYCTASLLELEAVKFKGLLK